MSEWMPIETAPKDGTVMLLAGVLDGPQDWRIKLGYWYADAVQWHIWGASWNPLHWQPLPLVPQVAGVMPEKE